MFILMLLILVLVPVGLLKLLGVIHLYWKIRLYWLIAPISGAAAIVVPFLIHYAESPAILVSWEAIIQYAVKTGYIVFLFVPSFVLGGFCTIYGYVQNRLSNSA